MIDHNWAAPHLGNNKGQGFALGLAVSPTDVYHNTVMSGLVNVICPQVTVVPFTPGNPLSFASICNQIQAAAIPFTWGETSDMDTYLAQATAAGVLVFAAVGDNLPATLFPAANPHVISCGAVNGDGSPNPLGNTLSGPCECAVATQSASAAAVMAACMSILAMPFLERLYGAPAQRLPGFRSWLSISGIPTQRGQAPDLSHL